MLRNLQIFRVLNFPGARCTGDFLYYPAQKLNCPADDLSVFLFTADDDRWVHWILGAQLQIVGTVVNAFEGVFLSNTDHANLTVWYFAFFDKDGITVEDPGIDHTVTNALEDKVGVNIRRG